jgi:hypothetical protein
VITDPSTDASFPTIISVQESTGRYSPLFSSGLDIARNIKAIHTIPEMRSDFTIFIVFSSFDSKNYTEKCWFSFKLPYSFSNPLLKTALPYSKLILL